MNAIGKSLMMAVGVFSLTGAFTATSTNDASAAVVCNRDGDCWKVRGKPRYKPEFGLRVYGDNWHWRRGENYRWRKVGRGHGYYRDGVWITIR
jgi:hypothetical protein